jgi:hypothetical protein
MSPLDPYLFRKQAPPGKYVNWLGITDLDGQANLMGWKPIFTKRKFGFSLSLEVSAMPLR